MIKKAEQYLAERNFVINGKTAYGEFGGFETNIMVEPTASMPFLAHFSCFASDGQRCTISQQLQAEKMKNVRFDWSMYGLSVFANDLTVKRLFDRMDSILEKVCEILKANGALGVGYCPICGKELSSDNKKCNVDGFSIVIDNECVQDINQMIDEVNKEFEAAPNHYLRGFAGAVLGGLGGVVVYVVLYLLGYLAAISAFISFALGAWLYGKFGGKQNKMMIVIVALTTLVLMLGTTFVIYLTAAATAAAEAGINVNAFEAFGMLMEQEEFSRLFVSDLLFTLLFYALGCGFEIFNLARRIKREERI